jgi:hypothetical protein
VSGWRKIGRAKNRLFYSLLRFELPLATKAENEQTGLAFDVLADLPQSGAPRVMTGHDNGLITIALAESDDVRREQSRVSMHEPYRTLLGHFRHEVGHYFWDRLVRDGGKLEPFRALFGDEQADYGQALQRHYKQARRATGNARFVSAYATMHPWEDFAETWAHYLHIVDTLEIARAFGLSTHLALRVATSSTPAWVPSYRAPGMSDADRCLAAAVALNSLNRAMGLSDLYPFVLSPSAIDKLGFVHEVVHAV